MRESVCLFGITQALSFGVCPAVGDHLEAIAYRWQRRLKKKKRDDMDGKS